MKYKDLAGQRFGRLLCIKFVGVNKWRARLWLCRCDCGKEITVQTGHLNADNVKSCGCLFIDTSSTHGMSKSSIYSIWNMMNQRCLNKKNIAYHNYGGRGIKVCDRWKSFENFYEDMGDRPTNKHTLERINNDGNYCPSNCKWDTRIHQAHNSRPPAGDKTGVRGVSWSKACKKYKVKITVNWKEIYLGLFSSFEEAVHVRKKAQLKYWNKEECYGTD